MLFFITQYDFQDEHRLFMFNYIDVLTSMNKRLMERTQLILYAVQRLVLQNLIRVECMINVNSSIKLNVYCTYLKYQFIIPTKRTYDLSLLLIQIHIIICQ